MCRQSFMTVSQESLCRAAMVASNGGTLWDARTPNDAQHCIDRAHEVKAPGRLLLSAPVELGLGHAGGEAR